MKNFKINEHKGIISNEFLIREIDNFLDACKFIAELPYKRNSDKNEIKCVFYDFGGTCSTKHATLRKLALENDQKNVHLMLGIFKMDSEYTVKIDDTLKKFKLKYIPEAHNYLKIDQQYFDFTNDHSDYSQFQSKILTEVEIEYDQINLEKITFHKDYLRTWILDEKIPYNLEQLWNIREKCIADLQKVDEV
ncbi:hypothetical protein [Chryseobacterium wangxinyae]|uniref:hypothetical protein n=1 Tax=Chryseobacterium sp. CY353 TaxID=2997334 RepID=UPI00226D9656|nr:hypothetical protein [Chryseobacterium sp. CY353]MCY0967586.1 hypothetical protein [Chryseobacterium sp. CY353]